MTHVRTRLGFSSDQTREYAIRTHRYQDGPARPVVMEYLAGTVTQAPDGRARYAAGKRTGWKQPLRSTLAPATNYLDVGALQEVNDRYRPLALFEAVKRCKAFGTGFLECEPGNGIPRLLETAKSRNDGGEPAADPSNTPNT